MGHRWRLRCRGGANEWSPGRAICCCNLRQHGYTLLKYMKRKGENCLVWGKTDLLKTKNSDIFKKKSAPIPVSTRYLGLCKNDYKIVSNMMVGMVYFPVISRIISSFFYTYLLNFKYFYLIFATVYTRNKHYDSLYNFSFIIVIQVDKSKVKL